MLCNGAKKLGTVCARKGCGEVRLNPPGKNVHICKIVKSAVVTLVWTQGTVLFSYSIGVKQGGGKRDGVVDCIRI